MKTIGLTKGFTTIVDDEYFDYLNQWKWHYANGYAARREEGTTRHIKIHRVILNAPNGFQVDHINHDKLDNRRVNLRLATNQENSWNRKEIKSNHSGHRGVCQRESGKWRAYIMIGDKQINLGSYWEKEEAIQARQIAERELYGNYSPLITN